LLTRGRQKEKQGDVQRTALVKTNRIEKMKRRKGQKEGGRLRKSSWNAFLKMKGGKGGEEGVDGEIQQQRYFGLIRLLRKNCGGRKPTEEPISQRRELGKKTERE